MQLTCTWTGTSLIAADDDTLKSLARLNVGQQVTWKSRKVRSREHHRMRFAWISELHEFLGHLNLFTGVESLRQLLTLKTDIGCTLCKDPLTGEVTKQARSWAYESIDEKEFSLMTRQIVTYLLTEFQPQAIVLGGWDNATLNKFQRIVINE
jgi:hypothetical protein